MNLHVGYLGITAMGNGGSAVTSPDARHPPDGATPRLAEGMHRIIDREKTPDLRSHCPICGNPYLPGEGVVALACLPFAASSLPSVSAAGCDSKMILGHHGCVLPRLLTLLADFQPGVRLVKATNDFFAGEPEFQEPCGQPAFHPR